MCHPLLRIAPVAAGGLALFAAAASSAWAQEVSGTVYDSIAGAPLAGARVQLADPRDLAAPLAATATTDSAGRFSLGEVPPGRYLVGFSHSVLEELGVEPPTLEVEVGSAAVALQLAVPGPARLMHALCGSHSLAGREGAIAGVLRDADSQLPVGGSVVARWIELVFGVTGFRQRVRQHTVSADPSSGRFLICELPADVEIALLAAHDSDATGAIPVTFARQGFVRRDLWIGSARSARISGRIHSARGAPVEGALVKISGSALEARTEANGSYVITTLPGGSRTVMVSALGYMPEQRAVDIIAGASLTLDIELTTVRTVLDTVSVMAERLYAADRSGFERRRRQGIGYFIDRSDIDRLMPAQLSDLFRGIPSARLEHVPGGMLIRMRGEGSSCAPLVFLDGLRLSGVDMSDLDRLVQPRDIESLEVYTEELAPAEFTTLDDCGVVVIWTRPTIPRPRR